MLEWLGFATLMGSLTVGVLLYTKHISIKVSLLKRDG